MEESFEFGNTSAKLKRKKGDNTHEWTVYVRPSVGKSFKFVDKVKFTLHHTFKDPVQGKHRPDARKKKAQVSV